MNLSISNFYILSLKKGAYLICSFFVLLFGFFLSKYPEASFSAVKGGVKICTELLIPSLFPFIFFSSLMINSGVYKLIGEIFSPLSNIFFIPKDAISVFLLSMVGGYPIGAKGIKDLFDKQIINSEQAERMLMFCVNSGPSFVLGIIGTSLLKNSEISFAILKSQILSSCVIAILLGILSRIKYKKIYNRKNETFNTPFGDTLINSCESSCCSILSICTLIIIFNIFFLFLNQVRIIKLIKGMMINLNFPHSISNCLPYMIFEVTKACIEISKNGNSPLLFTLATSWGGLCVHMQVFSIIKGIKIKYSKFLIYRLINSFLSCFFVNIFLNLKKFHIPNIDIPYRSNTIGSLILILFCVYFLVDINLFKNKNNFEKSSS